jgi:hypothetical protein
MAEYLGRESIKKFPIRKDRCDKEHANEHFIFGIESVLEYVENLPAADVAPVVRCRDCKHSYEDLGGLYCSFGPCVDCPVSPDFWCANGRRRKDAHAQD